ncbi:MBL fold metallo-hydrolase [Arenibacter palladensis]|uniref:MBL fold metallo-hydrolase n=1 Tax=Arenibacter palladensis TaxID=237373 RepID=UPI0026E2DFC2|nr:MBL fold metallo-hydrolase [Arenibacter palladensis]MDO6605205.1 hypothetical protein [Arenibacter palladensis]
MKLVIFRSSKGDALLISHPNGNGKNNHILVDGGMKSSFEKSVAPYLNKEIKEKNEEIDLLCVSHIDDDHIVGIITLMELQAQWRVFNYHNSDRASTANVVRPRIEEPPLIKSIWHNSFASTYSLGDALPSIVNTLRNIEQMTAEYVNEDLFEKVNHKATSIKNGITLSQRIRPEQLNIPLNPQYNSRPVKCNQSSIHKNEHAIGNIGVSVIGPFSSDLTELKNDWIAWELANRLELEKFYADLSLTAVTQPLSMVQLSEMLINSGTVKLGERNQVTIPNLASIMFLLEADGKTILMTGDGHSDDIIKGLKKNKKLSDDTTKHVNVLKIQHHGASANIDKGFCKKITADHYVFCGNGTHSNPEMDVLEVIFRSRKGSGSEISGNPEANNPFTFWFSAHPEDNLTPNQKAHLIKVKEKMEVFSTRHSDFQFKFMPKNKNWQSIEL